MALDLNLGSIISGFAAFDKEQRQQAEQVSGMQGKQAGLAQKQAGTVRGAVDDATLIHEVTKTAEMEAQNNARKFATAAGSNISHKDEVMTDLASIMRQTANEYFAAHEKVAEIEANSNLLGNPAGWLTDLLHGDQARAVRDNLKEKYTAARDMVQGLNATTQQTALTQKAISQTVTDATIAAGSRQIAADAELKATQKEIEGLGYGIASINTLRAQGAQSFSNNVRLYNMKRQEEQFAQQMEMRKAEFEQRARQLAKSEADEAAWEDIVQQVNLTNKTLGRPELPAEYIRANYNRQDQQGQDLRDLHYMGFNAAETGEMSYGPTAFEAAQNIARFGARTPASWQPALEVHTDAQQLLSQEIGTLKTAGTGEGKWGLNTANIEDTASLKKAYEAITRELTSQRFNASGGLDVGVIEEHAPEVLATPFGVKVLANLRDQGDSKPDTDRVFATAVAQIKKGELELNDAIDGMAAYYKTSASLETVAGGWMQLGLDGKSTVESKLPLNLRPTPGVDGWVRTTVSHLGSAFFMDGQSRLATARYDLGDPTQLTTAFQIALGQERAQEFAAGMRTASAGTTEGRETGRRPGPQ